MKYVNEFRDADVARALAETISREVSPDREYRLMEFCGGHTHAIFRYGIPDLLPEQINMIHGPGCPVCVLPMSRIDAAIALAVEHKVTLCSYGDMLRVPGSNSSLLKARAEGADIRMVYSVMDALKVAQENPGKEVVFFAIGFETTTPPTAVAIKQASQSGLSNFSVFCNHVLTPAAITGILDSPEVRTEKSLRLDGIVGPAHVSTVIGSKPYDIVASQYEVPVVISGFEPLDVLQSILMLVRQLNEGRIEVENEFSRAVTPDGNLKAQKIVSDMLTLRDEFEWRGLGFIPKSGLQIREEYSLLDAEKRFLLTEKAVKENKACECPAILRGVKTPEECKLFGTVCTPANPIGACMVSSEGACAAHYSYGRKRGTS